MKKLSIVSTRLLFCAAGFSFLLVACQRNAPKQSNEIPEDKLFALIGAETGIVVAPGLSCYSMPQQKGVLRITGVNGDSARLTIKCDNTVMGTCTATIVAPAGARGADRCVIDKVAVDGTAGLFSCSTATLAGNPTLLGGCQDP